MEKKTEIEEVVFNNISVSVVLRDKETPKDAYTRLCNALNDLGEFTTDTYDLGDGHGERSTTELFPDVLKTVLEKTR